MCYLSNGKFDVFFAFRCFNTALFALLLHRLLLLGRLKIMVRPLGRGSGGGSRTPLLWVRTKAFRAELSKYLFQELFISLYATISPSGETSTSIVQAIDSSSGDENAQYWRTVSIKL